MRRRLCGGFLALSFAVCILVMVFSNVYAAAPSLEIIDMKGAYPPGAVFNETFKLMFDTVIPENAQLVPSIDGSPYSSLILKPYLTGMVYQYKQYQFSYNITATGKNEWYESPDKMFFYTIKAEGTCGNQQCALLGSCYCALCTPPTTPPYSCFWSLNYSSSDYLIVNANEGSKLIINGSEAITLPENANPGDTRWYEILNNPSPYGVQTTMRMACGSMQYPDGSGLFTEPNGWIKRTLGGFHGILGTSKKTTIDPFDVNSLTTDRAKFIQGDCTQTLVCGGVYRNGTLLTQGSDYTINTTSWEITIYSFILGATYDIIYLPPNGPLLCAYSSDRTMKSTSWAKAIPQTGAVSYNQPFSKTYTQKQLPYVFNSSNLVERLISPPACPQNIPSVDCSQTVTSYSATKTSDPTGNSILVSFNKQTGTVNASLSSPDLATSYSKTISLSDFSDLKTPSSQGEYILSISLQSSGSEIASSKEVIFSVCEDDDNDGSCLEVDCNDTNPNVHPGAKELCNGIDDNCNDQVDEDFYIAGKRLGDACGLGICNGIYVCTADGKGVECKSKYKPDQFKEICGNGLDDDCDGVVDELYETDSTGRTAEGCVCQDGQRQDCKASIGEECKSNPGYRLCIKGKWTTCIDAYKPVEETCNGKDDDCNGIIDDVNGGNSITSTQCGCYGGAPPATEVCDEIDNNCNDFVDENIQCCSPGNTRSCGINKGICKSGIQTCNNNGFWETECIGAKRPDPEGEICYNNLDDNCNGKVDENPPCNLDFTCKNGKQDLNEEGIDCGGACPEGCGIPYNWLFFAGGVALLIVSLAILEIKSRL